MDPSTDICSPQGGRRYKGQGLLIPLIEFEAPVLMETDT